jgi:type 1 fimbria pilin
MFNKQILMSIFVLLFASSIMAAPNGKKESQVQISGIINFVGVVVEAPCNSQLQYGANNQIVLKNECYNGNQAFSQNIDHNDLQLVIDGNQSIALPQNRGHIVKERQYGEKAYVLNVVHY